MTDHKASRVEHELEGLGKGRLSGGQWPSESELRARSVRRRRQRLGASGFAGVALVIVIAVTSTALSGPGATHGSSPQARTQTNGNQASTRLDSAVELTSLIERARVSNPAAEATVANAEEEFSLKLLGELVSQSQSSDANQLVSPFSLAEALAMAQVGARGQTATQLVQALGMSSLSPSEQAFGWASLDEDLVAAAAHDHIALKNANSVWTQKGFPIEADFLKNLKSEFGAGVWQADFDHHAAAADRSVNAWVSQATNGQIPMLLQPGDTPAATAAVLLNAVLFEAQWATQLTNTVSGPFYSASGSVPVTYMSPPGDDNEYLSSVSSGLTAVQLPYWNGTGQQGNRPSSRYAALLLMPTSGSLGAFIASLDAGALDHIIGSMANDVANLSIPESKIVSNLELAPALEALGVKDAFGSSADFSGISSIATQISEVKQEATLRITKWGTVASAATAVVFQSTAGIADPRVLDFNRPFLFLVRDTKTGAILFESAINNPAAQS